MISERFRIKKPTLAVVEIDRKKTMAYIDAGITVVLVNGLVDAAGLVTVKWENQTVLMFDTDLRERAELIGVASAAA